MKKSYTVYFSYYYLNIFLPKELNKAEIEKGVTLDIARKHYSANSIKR